MDLNKMKAAIDTDAARAFSTASPIQLRGVLEFLRQQIVDAEWEIARAQQSITAYRAVIENIETALNPDRALRDNPLPHND
jgi:hypothetical protein